MKLTIIFFCGIFLIFNILNFSLNAGTYYEGGFFISSDKDIHAIRILDDRIELYIMDSYVSLKYKIDYDIIRAGDSANNIIFKYTELNIIVGKTGWFKDIKFKKISGGAQIYNDIYSHYKEKSTVIKIFENDLEDSPISSGINKFESGELDIAESIFTDFLKKKYGKKINVFAHFYLGKIYYFRNQSGSAVKHLIEANEYIDEAEFLLKKVYAKYKVKTNFKDEWVIKKPEKMVEVSDIEAEETAEKEPHLKTEEEAVKVRNVNTIVINNVEISEKQYVEYLIPNKEYIEYFQSDDITVIQEKLTNQEFKDIDKFILDRGDGTFRLMLGPLEDAESYLEDVENIYPKVELVDTTTEIGLDGVPLQVHTIINKNYVERMKDIGFEINIGNTPPNIEGNYLMDSLYIGYDENSMTGNPRNDYLYKFYEQKKDGNIKLMYKSSNDNENFNSRGAFITGTDNKFTIFLETAILNRDASNQEISWYSSIEVYSGEITEKGIKNFRFIFAIKTKRDPNDDLMAEGKIREIFESDETAEKISEYSF